MLLALLLIMTLLLLNVNGIHDSNKWKNIFNTILAVSPQIIALRETHLTNEQEYLFQWTLPNFQIFFENGTSNSARVLTAIKQNCGIKVVLHYSHLGHFLSTTCSWDGTQYKFINIYAPNDASAHTEFFEKLQMDLMDDNILLCVNFNAVMSNSDCLSKKLNDTLGLLNKLVRTTNLCEPQGFSQFTY